MSQRVYWYGVGKVEAQNLEAYRALIGEVIAHIEAEEPGTLFYDVQLAADGTTVLLHEHYQDSDAAMKHLMGFGPKFGPRYAALVEVSSITVFGDCSPALRAITDAMGATYASESLGAVCR